MALEYVDGHGVRCLGGGRAATGNRLRVGQALDGVADVAATTQRAARLVVAEVVEDAAPPAAVGVDEVLDRVVVPPATLAGDRQIRVAAALFVEADQAAEVSSHRQ